MLFFVLFFAEVNQNVMTYTPTADEDGSITMITHESTTGKVKHGCFLKA